MRPDGCALVVGAAGGPAPAIAAALRADGWAVALARSGDGEAAPGVAELELALDATGPQAALRLVDEVEARLGPVLALVACGDAVEAPDAAAWLLAVGRRALASMERAGFGRVVAVAPALELSTLELIVARAPLDGQLERAAARAGVAALARVLALEGARSGITANAVVPGVIDPGGKLEGDLGRLVPARRAGTPEEVAACVRFFASDRASYVTGATIGVDGGLSA